MIFSYANVMLRDSIQTKYFPHLIIFITYPSDYLVGSGTWSGIWIY